MSEFKEAFSLFVSCFRPYDVSEQCADPLATHRTRMETVSQEMLSLLVKIESSTTHFPS